MDNRKTFLAATFATITIAAFAMPGTGPRSAEASGRGHHVQQGRAHHVQKSGVHHPHTQLSGPRRSAFSSPNDPFHDTYKKNTGEIRREAPEPVNNLHAKISAARIAELERELERERAHKSPISCWSNYGSFSTVAVAQSAPATENVEQKSITIVNSNVTINQ